MMFSSRLRYRLSAAVCLLSPLFSAAQAQTPAYLSFQVPGSIATYPLSINDGQTITGYWVSSSGVTHGFVRQSSGVITSFDVPGSTFTEPVSINNAGEITGTYEVPFEVPSEPGSTIPIQQGFVRAANGTFTLFGNTACGACWNGNFQAQPVKINTSGEVLGNVPDPIVAPAGLVRSAAGVFQFFSLSFGADYPTVATGLNDSGAVIGYSSNDGILQAQGFLWSGQPPAPNPVNGAFAGITVPGSYGTFPTGINASGTVVGCYSINANAADDHDPVVLTYYDFVYQPNGTITTLKVPGIVPSCVVSGLFVVNSSDQEALFNVVPASVNINDAGTIVASYTSAANVPSAFMQRANGTITTFTDPNGSMTLPSGVNNSSDIIGYFSQGTTITGFLRLPTETCCTGSPVELTAEDPQGFFWDGGGSQWGVTALQIYQDYPSAGQNWTWTPVPGGFTVCTLGKVCLSDNGSKVVLSAKADVLTITNTAAVLDMTSGEFIQNVSAPHNGAYLSTGPTASSWNFSHDLH